nr:hypothetical protein [Tanacetum cinerariifolium]
MADLAFAPQHNMVAYLEKTEGNAKFHQIVDFFTSGSIHHALTVSPTIYASNIEQFWNTANSKTINDEKKIYATVDGKTVVIIESSMRRDLLFTDDNGITCLTNAQIFENLPLMGGGLMAQIRPEGAPIQSSDQFLSTSNTVGSGEDNMEHVIQLTYPVPRTPNDSPLSGGHTPRSDEGSITLKELMDLCITLSQKVLDLEKVKTAQEKEIASLKKRVTKIEQRQSSRILVVKKEVAQQETISTARPDISAARPELSTAKPKTHYTTKTFFDDEYVTIADTLVKMKNQKAKEKGVAFKDADDSARPIRSITTLQPLPTIDLKDKGKGILQEPKPMKKTKKRDQDQIERDAEVTLKIQADLDKEINTDHELAARLIHEEQDKYTVEERSKLSAEFFERKKKQLLILIFLGKLSAINGFEISLSEAVYSGIARESSDKGVDSTKKRKAGSRMKRMSKRQKTNADLEYCAKHNMVAYLEKTDGKTEFHKMVDFLTCSSIHYAFTVSPDVCTSFIKQFWNSATSKTLNNVSQIKAKVACQRCNTLKSEYAAEY